MRWVGFIPHITRFQPFGIPYPARAINLTIEELEALRLVDLEHLTQEEAAMVMGVSRKTLWNDLKSAREKVVRALVSGWEIRISGENYIPYRELGETKRDKAFEIWKLLPHRNCGACGYGNCIEFAKQVAEKKVSPDVCRFITKEGLEKIEKILEVM